jgi:hypothetical protein
MYCRSTVPPPWSYLAQGTTCRPCVPNLWAPPKEDHVGFVWNWVQNPLLKITVFHVSSFSSLVQFLGIPDSCRNHSRFFSCSPISSPSIATGGSGLQNAVILHIFQNIIPHVYIYIYLFIYLSIYLFIYLFIYSIYVFIYLFTLFMYLFIYVYVYVYVYVYICSTYISCSVIDEQKLNCSSVATWQACGRRVTRLSS